MGISLVIQWLRLCAGHMGSIPGQGTKIPYATQQKKKKKTLASDNFKVHLGKQGG